MSHRLSLTAALALHAILTVATSEAIAAGRGSKHGASRQDRAGTASYARAPFGFVADDPLASSQWHLSNSNGYANVNVEAAWNLGYTGSGVTIGIVDDGLQWDHPDLAPNYSAADSYDFGSFWQDPDPYPVYGNTTHRSGDNHGTSVAGVAGGRGGNGVGISGAAPYATLAGLRVDFQEFFHDDQFAAATRYRSTGTGATIDIKNHSYGMTAPYIPTQDELAALKASTSAGTIHVAAAGNGRGTRVGDSNKLALQNSPDTIAVGALAYNGLHTSYSSWGANLFATAPSSEGGVGITTTDRIGGGADGGYNHRSGGSDNDALSDLDYTSRFGGTSSSSPLVAGVLALAKEANPRLDQRMAKHLLVMTSDSSIDSGDSSETSDGGWTVNAAGNRFNQNYGFGLIDAGALVEEATNYFGVTEASYESLDYRVSRRLPDARVDDLVPGSLTATFELFNPGELEEMLIELDVDHDYRGDLQATLVSPSGTSSRLMMRDFADNVLDLDWTFSSNAFWGENPVGTWSLTLEDWFTKDTGVWNSFSATAITGSLIAIPEPGSCLLALLAATLAFDPRRRGRVAVGGRRLAAS